MNSSVSRISNSPGKRFEQVIVTHFNVGRNQIRHRGSGTTKHYVLSGGLKIVVDYLKRSRSIPTTYGLRILSDNFESGDLGVENFSECTIECDASLSSLFRITVNVTPIKNEMVWYLVKSFLRGVSQGNYIMNH